VIQECFSVGCTLVGYNSWPSAPVTTPIIGLKELPPSDDPLPHTHIQFAHCFKGQAGWSSILARFHHGQGTLYDLEFLTDPQGRRVAAFGYHAGFAGSAAGALAFAAQKKGETLGRLEPFMNENAMVNAVKAALGGDGKGMKALVMGALGRCGRGAVDLFRKIGLAECVSQELHGCHTELTKHIFTPTERISSNGIWRRLPKVGRFRRSWMSTFSSTAST